MLPLTRPMYFATRKHSHVTREKRWRISFSVLRDRCCCMIGERRNSTYINSSRAPVNYDQDGYDAPPLSSLHSQKSFLLQSGILSEAAPVEKKV
ncbi:hypothetical protein SCLCIDRAFT_562723 [Scleroderma citrinum Foug A]|uniref:Uncharacterized protein n=1 Tax=Scleroderma citrinum Foug A TaxID=1036808 RepID=A0A0C3DX51_9AGAM|nr:hypothetical protein SCLCIDRAFT_562723 [Scleroderma citrinum Foug A]